MENQEKNIQVDDNRTLRIIMDEESIIAKTTIAEGFMENGKLVGGYTLVKSHNYSFTGWDKNDKGKEMISFEFDINHPLYIPLFHLLNYDDELIIDDDNAIEDDKRHILIRREKDKIYLDFVNKYSEKNKGLEKFYIFIKDILPDGRSRVSQKGKDTKERLPIFFREAFNKLINDYYQIGMEEWILKDKSSDECKELKKVFKREYRVY